MIINLRFGQEKRHHIYFDTEIKRGSVKLWSYHQSTHENNDGFLSGLITRLESQPGGGLDANHYTEFLIEEEKDVFLILASLMAILHGYKFSFTSKEGRKIAFALEREESGKKDVVLVNVQYSKPAKLTIGEAHKFQTIIRHILLNSGYSEQELLERVKKAVKNIPN
jgi:hypothetical protein